MFTGNWIRDLKATLTSTHKGRTIQRRKGTLARSRRPWLRLEPLEDRVCLSDSEPNDTLAAATALAAGGQAQGYIGNTAAAAQDVDVYRLTLAAGELVSF